MNTEKIAAETQHFHIFTHFIISEAIKQYINYLMMNNELGWWNYLPSKSYMWDDD